MKIVVIGGTGLIGSKPVTRLRADGHDAGARSPRPPSTSSSGSFPRLQTLTLRPHRTSFPRALMAETTATVSSTYGEVPVMGTGPGRRPRPWQTTR
jgi:nucleoside-diphosphate-sugar epimerase